MCLCILLLSARSIAQPKDPPTASVLSQNNAVIKDNKITITIGERAIVPIEGSSPFAGDDSLLRVEELAPGRIALTGLQGGNTQLMIWQEGNLQSYLVEITLPNRLSTFHIGPQLLGDKLYAIYNFQNSSSFTKDQFFQSPTYAHALMTQTPFLRGYLQPFARYQNGSGGDGLTDAHIMYQDGHHRFTFGEAGTSLAQMSAQGFSSGNYFGSELQFFNTPRMGKFLRTFTLFGGVEQPANLLDLKVRHQIYGSNFRLTRQYKQSLFPDFFNLSITGYQPQNINPFKYGGVLETQFHIKEKVTIGMGGSRAPGGYAAGLQNAWERPHGLSRAQFNFTQHGFQAPSSTPVQNDQYSYRLENFQHLKDRTTLLTAALSHDIAIAQGNPTTPVTNVIFTQLGVRRQISFQNFLAVTYQLGRSLAFGQTTYTNSLGMGVAHRLRKLSYITHTLSFNRSDGSSAQNQVTSTSRLTTENARVRSDLTLNGTVTRGNPNEESIDLTENLLVNLRKGTIGVAATYNKATLRDGIHQWTVSPSLLYQLTSTHFLTLIGSSSLLVGVGNQFNGSLSLQYQHYFGPGVKPDGIIRHLVRGGEKAPVMGDLFLDTNYDDVKDNEDIPFAGVEILLDGNRKALTDATGHFVFPRVKAGSHTITLSPETLQREEPLTTRDKVGFQTDGHGERYIPLPVSRPRATILVQPLIDSNGNGIADDTDLTMGLQKVHYIPPSGEPRWIRTRGTMGIMVRGVELGQATIAIDPLDVPETLILIGPARRSVRVAAYEEYGVSYLFRPIRLVRGRIVVRDGKGPLRGLRVVMGTYSSSVDTEGYYMIDDIRPGQYTLELRGIPKGYCHAAPEKNALTIPEQPVVIEMPLELTTTCPTP